MQYSLLLLEFPRTENTTKNIRVCGPLQTSKVTNYKDPESEY